MEEILFLFSFLALVTQSARAGYWSFDASGSSASISATSEDDSGQVTINDPPAWSAPTSPGNNGIALSFPSASGTDDNNTGAPSMTLNGTAVVSITATWIPDPSLPSDPAPPGVWLIENSSDSWSGGVLGSTGGGGSAGCGMAALAVQTTQPGTVSGSASNGLGDADILAADGRSGTSATGETGAPAHDGVTYYATGTGGKVTISHTLSVSSEADGNGPGSAQVGGQLGTYSVKIHATPYNLVLNPPVPTDDGQGDLTFLYSFSSTSGKVSDLTSCFYHEYVTYLDSSGNVSTANPYVPPPPFDPSVTFPNPTGTPTPPSNGSPMTSGSFGDQQIRPPTKSPYCYGTFTSHQQWLYNDTFLMQSNVLIPSPTGVNDCTIIRTVAHNPSNAYPAWWYAVTKLNFSSNPYPIGN